MSHTNITCENLTVIVPSQYTESCCKSFMDCIKLEGIRFDDWSFPFRGKELNFSSPISDGDFKFVLFKNEDNEEIFPIIFSKEIVHSDLAEAVYYLTGDLCDPIHAGFISISNYSGNVFGRSESLDIDSNPEESQFYLDKFLCH